MKKSHPAARLRRSRRESLPAPRPMPTAAQWREILLKDLRQQLKDLRPPVRQDTCPVCFKRPLIRAQTVCSPQCESDLEWAAKQRALLEPTLRVAAFLHAREIRKARLFPPGRRPGHVAWHPVVRAIVRELLEQGPAPSSQEILKQLSARARATDSVIHEVVRTNREPCRDVFGGRCPPGYHVHWRGGRDDRLRSVSLRTIQNFVTDLKKLRRSS